MKEASCNWTDVLSSHGWAAGPAWKAVTQRRSTMGRLTQRPPWGQWAAQGRQGRRERLPLKREESQGIPWGRSDGGQGTMKELWKIEPNSTITHTWYQLHVLRLRNDHFHLVELHAHTETVANIWYQRRKLLSEMIDFLCHSSYIMNVLANMLRSLKLRSLRFPCNKNKGREIRSTTIEAKRVAAELRLMANDILAEAKK